METDDQNFGEPELCVCTYLIQHSVLFITSWGSKGSIWQTFDGNKDLSVELYFVYPDFSGEHLSGPCPKKKNKK